eukprot:jgi/Orpsp1_1/1185947/evm.model.c7180000096167.1
MSVVNGHFTISAINGSNSNPEVFSDISIKNSIFNQVDGEKGSIVYIDSSTNYKSRILFQEVTFQNMQVEKIGGLIFSTCKEAKKVVTFQDCTFQDIKVIKGTLFHSYNDNSEPVITNKNEIIQNYGKNAFSTNPTNIVQFSGPKTITLRSGEIISEKLRFYLRDDYDNVFDFGNDFDNINIEELFFYKIETNDELNTDLYGNINGFCWNNSCDVSNIRCKYGKFDNSSAYIEVKVKECNSKKYKHQFRESRKIESCYIPSCYQSCNTGDCINDDVCDCTSTLYTGKYCNEHYKVEEDIFYNTLLIIGSIILITLSIIFIVGVIIHKTDDVFRAASIDFLIIILIGCIIYCFHIISIVFTRSKITCIFIFSFKNVGFSLIYGSILAKTLRVYKVFKINKFSRVKKKYVYSIVFGLALIHLFLLYSWIVADEFDVEIKYTKKEEEFLNCSAPNLEFLSELINLIVISVSSFIAYQIRNIKKEFKESLAVPVYVYLLIEIMIVITNSMDEMPLLFKDFIHVIGSFISIVTVLYFIYINKFNTISFRKKAMYINQLSSREVLHKKSTRPNEIESLLYKNYGKVNRYKDGRHNPMDSFDSEYSIN